MKVAKLLDVILMTSAAPCEAFEWNIRSSPSCLGYLFAKCSSNELLSLNDLASLDIKDSFLSGGDRQGENNNNSFEEMLKSG